MQEVLCSTPDRPDRTWTGTVLTIAEYLAGQRVVAHGVVQVGRVLFAAIFPPVWEI